MKSPTNFLSPPMVSSSGTENQSHSIQPNTHAFEEQDQRQFELTGKTDSSALCKPSDYTGSNIS